MNSPNHMSDEKVKKTLDILKEQYIEVNIFRLKPWKVWLCIGIFAGISAAVALVANKSGNLEGTFAAKVISTPDNSLPSWFDGNRVQAHTRLSFDQGSSVIDTPGYIDAAATFKSFGAEAFVRHVKSRDEDPWWRIQPPYLPSNRNIVKEMIDATHAEGMHMIAYYYDSINTNVAAAHPEWVCKDLKGNPQSSMMLDLTSPYRDIVLQDLRDLAAMGADGIYFDADHMPGGGCFAENINQLFTQATGLKIPAVQDINDPTYRRYMNFQASQVEATFAYWKNNVQKSYPQVLFLISMNRAPQLTANNLTTKLAAIADSVKTEYSLALRDGQSDAFFQQAPAVLRAPDDDIRMAFGYTLMRDSANGRPPHIWAPGFPNVEQTLGFVGAVTTYGGIANVDVDESLLVPVKPKGAVTPLDAVQAAFALGKKISPALNGARPIRWAAIHFSESARDKRINSTANMWKEVLWPTLGAFQSFVRIGVPIGVVNDTQLETGDLAGYKLLFLPNPDELTTDQKKTVTRFKRSGGVVIANNSSWAWGSILQPNKAQEALRAVVQPYMSAAPIRVSVGPIKMHSVAFQDPAKSQFIIAVTNDFSWVDDSKYSNGEPNPTPPPVTDAVVAIRTNRQLTQATEVISGQSLTLESTQNGYRVTVPEFQTMALVVVK